jgi:DSF synthase
MSNMKDAVGLRHAYGKAGSQLETEFDPATGTLWGYMKPRGTPCFSLGLLKEIREHDAELVANGVRVLAQDSWHAVRYYVGGSRTPGVFNLGGDLALFMLLMKTRDREALSRYARMSIDNLYPRIQNYGSPTLTTISMVQGDALGGGFECALSSDVIIAEESAQMGLPEIMFNLFPGMGAYSLLARRIGVRGAEELILAGRLFPATKLYEMGVVDVLAKDGQGETATQEWIAGNLRRRNGTQALYQARKVVNPISRAELDGVVEIWVDAAMRLEERDLKMMNWLVRGQQRRMEAMENGDAGAAALVPAVAAAV